MFMCIMCVSVNVHISAQFYGGQKRVLGALISTPRVCPENGIWVLGKSSMHF